jgi:hypothetical protein
MVERIASCGFRCECKAASRGLPREARFGVDPQPHPLPKLASSALKTATSRRTSDWPDKPWNCQRSASKLRRVPSVQTPAIEALSRLYLEIFADLDPDLGGIRWMRDQLDWQRASLIGDYFMSAISGVQSSLNAAANAAKRYRQREYTDNQWISGQWGQTRKQPGATPDDFFRDIQRDPKAMEREVEMLAAAEDCLVHLVQGLDRLAVCIAVVGALRVKLLTLDWNELTELAEYGISKGHQLFHQSGPGQAEQQALLTLVNDEPAKHGPTDWLPWLLRARSTVIHRPPKTWLVLMTADGRRPTGLSRPFHRQPGWREMEAWLRSRGGGVFEIILNDEPASTLDGLTGSVCDLVTVLANQCSSLVSKRRADPSLLVQSGRQWADYFDKPLLDFPGYGKPPKARVDNAQMHVSPDTGRRMRAFRLLDAQAVEWRRDSESTGARDTGRV